MYNISPSFLPFMSALLTISEPSWQFFDLPFRSLSLSIWTNSIWKLKRWHFFHSFSFIRQAASFFVYRATLLSSASKTGKMASKIKKVAPQNRIWRSYHHPSWYKRYTIRKPDKNWVRFWQSPDCAGLRRSFID